MPAEFELSERPKLQYEGGSDGENVDAPPPRKLNPMEKQKQKHQEKLDAFNVREASEIGDTVINLNRSENTDPVFCGLLIFVLIATIGLAIYGFTAGGTIAYAPFLSDGTQCGHPKGSMANADGKDAVQFPYLYFPIKNDAKQQVGSLWNYAMCVSECPTALPNPGTFLTNPQMSTFPVGDVTSWATYETSKFGLLCKPT